MNMQLQWYPLFTPSRVLMKNGVNFWEVWISSYLHLSL